MKFIRCSIKMTRLTRIFGVGALILIAVQLIATRTAFASGMAQQNLRGESELPWLFAVYIITWAAFFGYIFMLSRRQREMRREIDALKRASADRETKS
jgi:CcmD family protein